MVDYITWREITGGFTEREFLLRTLVLRGEAIPLISLNDYRFEDVERYWIPYNDFSDKFLSALSRGEKHLELDWSFFPLSEDDLLSCDGKVHVSFEDLVFGKKDLLFELDKFKKKVVLINKSNNILTLHGNSYTIPPRLMNLIVDFVEYQKTTNQGLSFSEYNNKFPSRTIENYRSFKIFFRKCKSIDLWNKLFVTNPCRPSQYLILASEVAIY